MSDLVTSTTQDRVTTLTLNDPPTRNAISDIPMIDALCSALDAANADAGTRAVILTGSGSAFSAGGNLKTMGKPGQTGGGTPVEKARSYDVGIQRIPRLFRRIDVPVIAAVNGPAIGAGCDLACMCDIRIAGESALFAESFVKIGIIPGDGGAWLLQRVIGFSRAAELTFTGRAVKAEEALDLGLVSSVVPDAEVMDAARAMAASIAANPPHAVRMAKRLMTQARDASLDATLELSAVMQALAHTTEDHGEAVSAFLEKRAPSFKGS